MYYHLVYRSESPWFLTEEEAHRILTCVQNVLDRNDGCLLDYLLFPCHCEFLYRCTASLQLAIPMPSGRSTEQIVAPQHLKTLIRRLGRAGKNYPLSGTFELFHRSRCHCTLGKAGTNDLPFTVRTIISLK
jgi:hypothetical protein